IFCSHCGNRLNNKCADCGFTNLPSQKFCGNCGKQLQADTELTGSALRYGQSSPVGAAALAEPQTQAAMLAPPGSIQTPIQPAVMPVPNISAVSTLAPDLTPIMPPQVQLQVQSITPPSRPVSAGLGLDAYALGSLELANWDALKGNAADSAAAEAA